MIRISSLFSLIALSTLTGCFDEEPIVLPDDPTPSGVELIEGSYEVQIVAVEEIACQGMRPRDLVGETLYVDLAQLNGPKVRVDWDGLALYGSMKDSALSVSGSEAIWYDDTAVGETGTDTDTDTAPPDDGSDTDPVGEEDTGGAAPEPGDCGDSGDTSTGSGGSSEDTGGSSGGSSGSDCGDTGSEPGDPGDADMIMELSMDLVIRTDRIADGRFTYRFEGDGMSCSLSAQVSVAFSGRHEARPQPVYEEETEVDTEVDTGADTGEADAG